MEINTVQTDLILGIISRNEYLQIKDKIDKEGIVLISISDESEDGLKEALTDEQVLGFDDVIRTKFWDVEQNIGNYTVINDKVAKEIREFILRNKDKRFLIHCRAGQSRSAGVGMAVECLINHNGEKYQYSLDGTDIVKNPRYSPNLIVYDKILKS